VKGGSRSSFKVRFGDTDPWGVTYYVSFFRYANQAVEDYLSSLMGKPASTVWRDPKEGYGLPVVEAKGSFFRPVRYGDEIDAFVEILEKREKGVSFLCSFVKEGEEVARVELVCVCIDPNWIPRKLPSGLKRREEERDV